MEILPFLKVKKQKKFNPWGTCESGPGIFPLLQYLMASFNPGVELKKSPAVAELLFERNVIEFPIFTENIDYAKKLTCTSRANSREKNPRTRNIPITPTASAMS